MSVLNRLRSMDAEELRFRLACEARKASGRVRAWIAPPRWRRRDLERVLIDPAPDDSAALTAARRALSARDFLTAHAELARHYAEREPRFALDPRAIPQIVQRVRARFPDAADDARRRADRILEGTYDLLGYDGMQFGATPSWNRDPIHGRRAPRAYWASIQYLNRRHGDHKIIWELNRHQHWLALARAYHLTSDGRYRDGMVRQLESWMAGNPPHRGINWASMLELGLRAISWTWALHFFAADPAAEEPWIVDMLLGLDRQLQHVENNLSRYFSPNTHLLGEALALYVVSAALPELRGSERRLALGRSVLVEELDRQVNADGGHAELSAHYHRYTTDFYLLAALSARMTRDPAAAAFEAGLRKVATYLRALADDRGQLPLIGDDDGGRLFPICARDPFDCRDTLAEAAAILDEPALLVSDVPEDAFWFCGMLPLENLAWRPLAWPSTAMPDSGYYISRTANHDHLVFDAGPHGFLNGGHAHADALSLVLTVGGRPVLVDSGTATYTMNHALRDRFRSTAMHNTVVVNGVPQSQPKGPFHWQTTTDARARIWMSEPAFDYMEGNHEAYAPIVHARSVLAVHGLGWIVIDHLLGPGTARADAYWHVHPSWTALQEYGVTVLRHRDGSMLPVASSAPLEIAGAGAAGGLGAYAPIYGRIERAACLRARVDATLPFTIATFFPSSGPVKDEPGARCVVAALAIAHPLPAGWHGAAFKLSVADDELVLLAAIERAPHTPPHTPGADWGTDLVQTDARIALIHLSRQDRRPIVIHGSHVESAAGLVRA